MTTSGTELPALSSPVACLQKLCLLLLRGAWLLLWAWRLPNDLCEAGLAETPLGSPGEKPSLPLVAASLAMDCRRDRMVAVVPGQFDDADASDR